MEAAQRAHIRYSLPAAQEPRDLLHNRLRPQGLLVSRQLRSLGAARGRQRGGLLELNIWSAHWFHAVVWSQLLDTKCRAYTSSVQTVVMLECAQ